MIETIRVDIDDARDELNIEVAMTTTNLAYVTGIFLEKVAKELDLSQEEVAHMIIGTNHDAEENFNESI